MNAFLKRLVTLCVLLFLSVMLLFQNAALAGPRAGDGDSRTIAKHAVEEDGGPGAGSSGWRLPDMFWRPRPGRPVIPQVDKIAEAALKDRDRAAGGAGGRDAGQRERNQESGHKGFGGPQ